VVAQLRQGWPRSNSQQVQVAQTMLPDPIYSFGGLVAKIAAVKITAQEENELHAVAVGGPQLMHLGGFFVAALVHVGEVARAFRFHEYRQPAFARDPGLND